MTKRSRKIEKVGVITEREYSWLKSMKNLEPHEQAKVEEFEQQKLKEYKSIPKSEPRLRQEKKVIHITKGLIWKNFKIFYKAETGNEFIETPDSLRNVEPIIKYFAGDEDFFKCKNLISDFNEPSFQKGLLILGKFGNGKTSIMNSLGSMFREYQMPMKFQNANAHNLVSEWESISNPGDKSLFFEKYTCKALYIDDVKKEREASNYGKTEVIRDILEKRYDKRLRTYITCNHRETDFEGSVQDALEEFNRYGNHIYDRLFEMFNIIHFKGKSFRK